jgi:hypothetical protein
MLAKLLETFALTPKKRKKKKGEGKKKELPTILNV